MATPAMVRAQVLDNLGEAARRVDIYQIDHWLDDGVREIAHRLNIIEVTGTVAVAPLVQEIDCSANILAGRLRRVRGIKITDSESRVYEVQFVSKEVYDSNVNPNHSGRPTTYTVWGDSLRLSPKADVAYTLEVDYYQPEPATIRGTTADIATTTGIPQRMHKVIPLYASSLAFKRLGDPNMAQEYERSFEKLLFELEKSERVTRDDGLEVSDDMGYTQDAEYGMNF